MSRVVHDILLALGSNSPQAKEQLHKMLDIMRVWWSDVRSTDALVNPAIGMPKGTPDYANQLVKVRTTMDFSQVHRLTKLTEKLCGRGKKDTFCKADIDILQYDDQRYHHKDWERSYVKQLLGHPFRTMMTILFLIAAMTGFAQTTDTDKDKLAKAIEYFGGQKYHEALLTFNSLEKTHRLSSRMQAYKGVCYFKVGEYQKAVETLEPVAKELSMYPPHEQAVYFYAWGESHFQQGHYFETIPCFTEALKVCNQSDRAEVCYRLGFSQMICAEYEDAMMWFEEAERYYDYADDDETIRAHREQARIMLKALIAQYRKPEEYVPVPNPNTPTPPEH